MTPIHSTRDDNYTPEGSARRVLRSKLFRRRNGGRWTPSRRIALRFPDVHRLLPVVDGRPPHRWRETASSGRRDDPSPRAVVHRASESAALVLIPSLA
jgi:hypothetical protein